MSTLASARGGRGTGVTGWRAQRQEPPPGREVVPAYTSYLDSLPQALPCTEQSLETLCFVFIGKTLALQGSDSASEKWFQCPATGVAECFPSQ